MSDKNYLTLLAKARSISDISKSRLLYKEIIEKFNVPNNVIREYCDLLVKTKDKSNLAKAFDILLKLTEQGDELASGRIARFYRDGIVVENDDEKAIYYYSIGASKHVWMKKEMLELLLKNRPLNSISNINDIGNFFNKKSKLFESCILTIIDNELYIDFPKLIGFNTIFYKVYLDNCLIYQSHSRVTNIKYKINRCGLYRISGYIDKLDRVFNSNIESYFDDKFLVDFSNHMSSAHMISNQLPFYSINYPFCDFAVVKSNKRLNSDSVSNFKICDLLSGTFLLTNGGG